MRLFLRPTAQLHRRRWEESHKVEVPLRELPALTLLLQLYVAVLKPS